MRDSKIPGMGREENYLVKATVIVNGAEISNIPCKIYLPERIDEKPHVILKPSSRKDATRIMASHKGMLRASVYGFDDKIQTTIEAPEIYFLGSSTKIWGDDLSDNTITGEPQGFHVVDHLRDNDLPPKTQIVFWLSPNRLLTPSMAVSSSYTGDVKYERARKVEFIAKDKINLVFDKHFHSKKAQNGDFIQWSFLVACTELDIPADDVEALKKNILPVIDDFLLLASFAARHRTACLGWEATDKNSHATFYRGNYVFPHIDGDSSLHNGIIDILDFESFMQTCYPAFLRFENKLAIRDALYSIVPLQPRTLETSFLGTFAGLETLILNFRREKDREFVFPSEDDWNSFREYLERCTKECMKPKLNKEQRKSIYDKLDELKRVPLREAFDMFCQNYSIDLADLWPVFGGKKLVGLVNIRNKLIHGDPFPHDLYQALVVANEHLTHILERVLARILQWDIAKTKINPHYLRTHSLAIKNMTTEQTRLFEYIYGSASPGA